MSLFKKAPKRQGLYLRKLRQDGMLLVSVDDGFESPPPAFTSISQRKVIELETEGRAHLVNPRRVDRPSGPFGMEHIQPPHSFLHADELVFHTPEGDVTYRVTKQPDKYAADLVQHPKHGPVYEVSNPEKKVTPELYAAGLTDVHWFFELELVV